MKNLAVCADGTWCTADQEENGIPTPTNVVRLMNCLDDQAKIPTDGESVTVADQLRYYHPGVGTEGRILSRLKGGAWGEGLSKNIQSAYHWLARNYSPGDRIFLFGFSRGAYTVRSLGGVLGRCGLLNLAGVPPEKGWKRVKTVYQNGYRNKEPHSAWARNWKFHHKANTPIRFLGVWDTVGALGIPDDMPFLNLMDQPRKWNFHDTKIGKSVEVARHAIALDEHRASFTPTLWVSVPKNADVKQIWFPGSHSDVGGGYVQTGLSNIALIWMIQEAEAAGLAFKKGAVGQIQADPQCVLHDSFKGIFKAVRSRPRNTPKIKDDRVHESARRRHESPPITQAPYRPTTVLKKGDKPIVVDIYACERWNSTGLYLPEGKYRFSARGEWLDWNIPCGPGGTDDGEFKLGEVAHLFGTTLGWLESAWKGVSGNEQADFKMTRRHEQWPWFSLVGAIANCKRKPATDGTPHEHQEFLISAGTTKNVSRGGYLYAYANDAWDFYDNNRGSVQLTVKRLE
ncbi:MAG: DUF2235 domain-containing protein [Xanthomonadales bacterium]|nr:DUF2235 domain-containing protein [Xanthomonadales bacterium]